MRSTGILTGLDDDQRRAVETVAGPLLVVAGPGSGKTRILTCCIAHLVTSHGVPPARCLAITFTRRAAGEMRARLRALLPDAWEQVVLHTFRSLGLSIVQKHHNEAGLQRGSVRERLEAVCLRDGERDPHLLEACELPRPAAVASGDDLERFVSDVSLGSEVDTWDPRADRISLLTLHAAKGLESPVVFIPGCERGVLPQTWGRIGKAALDEERRPFCVGVTRAMSKLYLCRARRRRWREKMRELLPSPYPADIEERLVERRHSRLRARHVRDEDDQLNLLS